MANTTTNPTYTTEMAGELLARLAHLNLAFQEAWNYVDLYPNPVFKEAFLRRMTDLYALAQKDCK
jgi:hypothetical protein